MHCVSWRFRTTAVYGRDHRSAKLNRRNEAPWPISSVGRPRLRFCKSRAGRIRAAACIRTTKAFGVARRNGSNRLPDWKLVTSVMVLTCNSFRLKGLLQLFITCKTGIVGSWHGWRASHYRPQKRKISEHYLDTLLFIINSGVKEEQFVPSPHY